MDYEKECKELHMDLDDALEVTRDFLEWYIEYLRREEPYAINSINLMENMVGDLPGSMKDQY